MSMDGSLINTAFWVGGIVLLALMLWGVNRILERQRRVKHFSRHLVMMAITFIAILVALLALPDNLIDNQTALNLVGIATTVIVTLSSATLVANAMAGIMLRSVRSFRAGDFIRVDEYMGRVSERGLFHVEIQTAQRDLVTLPNRFLISRPTTVVRSSGTVVVADVSLGYDAARQVVEPLLIEAAERAGLEDPFVQVRELGDYSVTYRAAGVLTDVKTLFDARSLLRRMVLDTLHGAGVEIPSPMLVGHRPLPSREPLIPEVDDILLPRQEGTESSAPSELIFDKADQAEAEERARVEVEALRAREKQIRDEVKATSELERPKLEAELEGLRTSLAEAETRLVALEEVKESEDE